MGFHEVRLPTEISYGSSSGPGHNTKIIEVDSGQEERQARWGNARVRMNLIESVKDPTQIAALVTFVRARQGSAYGFRCKDWVDYTSAADHVGTPGYSDQAIGTGDGTTATFQLVKLYTSGAVTRTRSIEKPVAGTIRIAFDGVEQSSGWTANTSTGVVTFTTAPSLGVAVTAGFEFDVPVRFDEEVDRWMATRIDAYDMRSIDSLPVTELKDESPVDDEFWYGDANVMGSISANASITVAQGRVVTVTPTTGGLLLSLPDYSSLPAGGPYFFVTNLSGTHTLSLRDHLGNAVITIGTLATVEVVLAVDGSSNKIWYAF